MLFIYGTLQDPDVLSAVLGRPLDCATLPVLQASGYRAVTHPGRVYPALVGAAGAVTPGLGLAHLDADDLLALDAFEGDEYTRRSLVVLQDGLALPAEAYFPVAAVSADSPAWSLESWTRRHKAAVIGTEIETAAALRRRLSAARSP